MLSILTEQNVQASLASLKPTDILISPDLGDFSTGDFDNLTKITPLGEAAARKVADRLAQLSLPPERIRGAAPAPAGRGGARTCRPVDEIRFEQLHTRQSRVGAGRHADTGAAQPVDQASSTRDMRRLYGTGDFEHVNYRILEEPGKRVLVVDAVEKAWGPNYLRFGHRPVERLQRSTRTST